MKRRHRCATGWLLAIRTLGRHACTATLGLCLLAGAVASGEETSLLYVDPYDEITLNEENNGAVLKVFLLELPKRRVPKAPNPTDVLGVRLRDKPDQRFEVEWKSIKQVRLFEEMLLEEAARLVAAGQFDEAYEYYEHLDANFPQSSGVKEAIEGYLWGDALKSFDQQRDDQCLTLLVELHRRRPDRPGLAEQFALVTARIVERDIEQANYRAARGLLRNLAANYPEAAAATVEKYQGQLRQRAAALKSKALAQLKAGQAAEARRSAAAMTEIWPKLPGAAELAQKIHKLYPTLVVAVSSLPNTGSVLDEWPQRRDRRLTRRELAELTATGPRGGQYLLPLGSIEPRKEAGSYSLQLRSAGSGVRGLTAPDVASCLARLTDPRSPAYDPALGQQLVGAAVQGSEAIFMELRGSAVPPQPWLTGVLAALPAGDHVANLAPFVAGETSDREARFTANADYALAEPGQAREIVERAFADNTLALAQLRGGQVGVVDRLSPWEVAGANAGDELKVEPYALPTVHVLLCNQRKPLLAQRAFRRALVYAIDRPGILERALLGGRPTPGSVVISGPFPRGCSADDLHGYAYDTKLAPRAYDLDLARLLLRMALDELGAPGDRTQPIVVGPLRLVHPPEAVAQVACLSIQRQLRASGIEVQLEALPAGRSVDPDFDLAYAELAMAEPAADVWRLFGPGGLSGPTSPALGQALRELAAAEDWSQVCQRLQAIHRLVHDESDLIPLWQVVEHLAAQPGVSGLGARPVTLYDHVEQWKIELRVPKK